MRVSGSSLYMASAARRVFKDVKETFLRLRLPEHESHGQVRFASVNGAHLQRKKVSSYDLRNLLIDFLSMVFDS